MVASVSAGLVGLTLLVAGLAKLVNPAGFREALVRMVQLPPAASGATSVALPVMEIVLAALLLLGLAVKAAATAAAVLLLIFSAVITRILLRRQSVNCACFGSVSREPVRLTAVARNGFLIACCVIAAGAPPSPATRLPGTLAAALLSVSGVLLVASMRMSALVRRVSTP